MRKRNGRSRPASSLVNFGIIADALVITQETMGALSRISEVSVGRK